MCPPCILLQPVDLSQNGVDPRVLHKKLPGRLVGLAVTSPEKVGKIIKHPLLALKDTTQEVQLVVDIFELVEELNLLVDTIGDATVQGLHESLEADRFAV